MKKNLLRATVLAIFLLSIPMMVAFADGNVPPDPPPGTLPAGGERYTAILDIASIPELAQNDSGAASGAFGYLGKEYNMGIKFDANDPGANGYKTGLNNSGVAGNRQGNLP
jgi:hypothetical protein